MKVIKINGKDYVIKYTMNSLVEMEMKMGKPFTEVFAEDTGVSLAVLRLLMYSGLKYAEKDLTIEATGDLISTVIEEGKYTLESLTQSFVEEMMKALGIKANMEEVAEKEVGGIKKV